MSQEEAQILPLPPQQDEDDPPPPPPPPPPPIKCSVCSKDLSYLAGQQININRHVEKCQRDVEKKKKEKAAKEKSKSSKRRITGPGTITNYFSMKRSKVVDEQIIVEGVEQVDEQVIMEDVEQVLGDEITVEGVEQVGEEITVEGVEQVDEEITVGGVELVDEEITVGGVELVEVSEVVNPVNTTKCQGFLPTLLGSVFRNFPFHLLEDHRNIIFEGERFHDISCMKKQYLLQDSSNVNTACAKLVNNEKLRKIIDNANDSNKHLSTAKTEYLTHHQLTQRLDNIKSRLNAEKLKSVNRSRKLMSLNKSLELHQRFMILIKEKSIPKLHELVKVALKHKRSLSYIIQKIADAVDGTYNARSSEEDRDLAFLILQYGGPGLLDIVHRALNFPSTSTAYRLLKSSRDFINSSVKTEVNKFVENIELVTGDPSHGYMLKIDETYVEAKVRWNPRDNSLYGLCYEHSRDKDLTFSDFTHVESIADSVKKGEMHVPKETMVIACSSNSPSGKVQVVAALPTCSKDEIQYQANLIDTVSSNFQTKYGVPLLNWSTDGDPTRRQIFHALMSHELKNDSPIYPVMSKLRLIDLQVGRNEETTNFDAKHLSKRTRTSIVGGNFKIGEIILSRSDIAKILACVENESSHSTEQLMNPSDKQNVPLATQFLLLFCKAVDDIDKLKMLSFKITGVAVELHLFKYVIEGLLCTYIDPKITIKEQLQKISLAAHVLMVLQRNLRTFIPNQLYHDLQSSFEDAFFCAAKWKIHHPDLPLFLMLCSNDVIERFFGILRAKYRQCSVDNLEIIYATRALQICTDMMSKHPEWFKKNRNVMQRICLDYSNPRDWSHAKLLLLNVDIVSTFNVGRANAEQILNRFDAYRGDQADFFELFNDGYTFLIPYGTRKIGFNPQEIDFSLDNLGQDVLVSEQVQTSDALTSSSSGVDDSDGGDEEIEETPSTSIIDMVEQNRSNSHDTQIEVDGSYVYKATAVKSMFSSNPMSRDRLRRVRGLSKYADTDQVQPATAIDTSLMVGDPLLIKVKQKMQIAKIDVIKKANRKVKLLNVAELNDLNISVDATILKIEDVGNHYIWKGEFIGESFKSTGKDCYAIQPELEEVDGKINFAFDKQLILDLEVAVTVQEERQHSSSAAIPPASTSDKKNKKHMVNCFLCKKKIDITEMRKHVGEHIMKGTISGIDVCGFCGKKSCENILKKTSTKASKEFFKVQSNCEYFVEWKKTPQFSSRNPCSNHLIICTICKASVWTYNVNNHYSERHPDIETPSFVSEDEAKKMKKK